MEMDLADHFEHSGPTHLMARSGYGSFRMMTDWNKEEHRRCIAACIVKSTYVMENDQGRRRGVQLAAAWWRSFHFDLTHVFEDNRSIFGAIYRHVPPAGWSNPHPSAPHYIVAFRGTMTLEDMHLNYNIMTNTVHESTRSQNAHHVVCDLLATIHSRCVVWLTGHSQGASLALEVGRDLMLHHGRNLPAFLFNPPQVSLAPAIDSMHSPEEAADKWDLYAFSNLVKASLGKVLHPHRKRMEKLFEQLSPWAPKMYVHETDFVCKGFIDYFQQREQLEKRFRGAARSATTLSYRDMLFHLLGEDTKPRPHLLPSATLWKNSSNLDFPSSHSLKHWWKPDGALRLTPRRYTY